MAAVLLGCAGLRAADYHFAEGGSDANDGLSPERPMRTIGRLNALDLQPGDRVLFRRGDLFRGAIKAKNGVTYAAYGEGHDLPTICASKRDYADPKLWEKTSEPNVWRCTEKLHNVGIILFDREPRRIDGAPVVADMRLPKRNEPYDKPVVLDADLTFRNLFREDRLELRSDKGNPGERFRHIEIGEHGHCLWINADDLLIENLHLTLSGSHGVGGSGDRRNITVRHCRIDWLGGSIIEGWKFGTVRFGNAIEIWGGCDGFYALDNRIANVYDTGVTIQCNDRENFVCRMENVLFASNVIDNCFWGLEYYNRNNAPGSFTRNVRFVGNLCRGTGRGWGCKGREVRAPAISIGETPEESSGNVAEGNRFLGSTGPLVTLREPVAKGSWSFRGNVYAQRPGGILVSREPPRKTFAASVEKVRPQTFRWDVHAAETVRRELGDTEAVTTTLPSVRADALWVRVAASDSSDAAKMSADYVCAGTNDQDVVQAAIDRAATDGRNVYFHNGCYYLDAVREVSDAGPMAAVVVPVVKREFRLEGEGFPVTAFQFSPTNRNGVCLRVRSGVFENAKGRSVDFVRGGWTHVGIHNGSALRMENFIVYAPDAVHPYRCLDLRRVDRVEIKNMIFYAMGDRMFAGDRYPYKKLGPLPVPVLDAIALTMTDGSNYGIARYDNIFAVGFGQGIQAGGEHVICNSCLCAFGLYGWTFGNYEYSCAFNHPITLINCSDEQNVNLPLFASCGDKGGKLHGLQEVTMISFNCERVAGHTPGGRIGDDMRETRPGTWRGQIGFTRQPAWNAINSVDLPLWAEDGSGVGFVTRNNAHKSACTSAERRSYYPQYMQQVYDTDLNKLLICTDPAKRVWRDAMGSVVR